MVLPASVGYLFATVTCPRLTRWLKRFTYLFALNLGLTVNIHLKVLIIFIVPINLVLNSACKFYTVIAKKKYNCPYYSIYML